ncbi:MAG: DUF3696 domain-containing protein [Flavobacteriales bacterium]|nr:DUF3696 domain-containing protein [Flavobacteriales bacterium]
MTHLTHFGLGNFRVFKETALFELKPITILTGTNSSGKSSLTKGLLVVKNLFKNKIIFREKSKWNGFPELDTDTISELEIPYSLHLGNLSTCANKFIGRSEIELILPISLDEKKEVWMLTIVYKSSEEKEGYGTLCGFFLKQREIDILNCTLDEHNYWRISVNFKFLKIYFKDELDNLKTELLSNNSSLFNYSFLEEPQLLYEIFENTFEDKDMLLDFVEWNKQLKNEYEKEVSSGKFKPIEEEESDWLNSKIFIQGGDPFTLTLGDVLMVDIIAASYYTDSSAELYKHFDIEKSPMKRFVPNENFIITHDRKNTIVPQRIELIIQNLFLIKLGSSLNETSKMVGEIEYMPSIRSNPSRIFLYDDDSVFKLLLKKLTTEYIPDFILNFIKDQIIKFEIADEFEFVKLPDGIGTRVVLKKDGYGFDLMDVGYGFSQILPIILQLAIMMNSENKLLIIEEPETNLHPALQSKLADMFVECFKRYNIQFIIETHSEYLIRKLQYLTGKGEIEPEMTQMYYFNHPEKIPEGENQIKKINIQKDGSLTDDFGTGFFDEATNWKFELTKLKNSQRN